MDGELVLISDENDDLEQVARSVGTKHQPAVRILAGVLDGESVIEPRARCPRRRRRGDERSRGSPHTFIRTTKLRRALGLPLEEVTSGQLRLLEVKARSPKSALRPRARLWKLAPRSRPCQLARARSGQASAVHDPWELMNRRPPDHHCQRLWDLARP